MLLNCGEKKTLESPLDSKEIQPVNLKRNQSWIFTGRTDAEAEALIPWQPDEKSWLTGKDPDAGKDLRQEEKGMIEDEMDGWPQGTWVWASSRRSCRTGKPGVLQSMGLQRIGHGRKVMTNLDSILKSRDITLPTKVRLVKAMVFPVVVWMWELGLWRKLSTGELMLLNCGVGGDSWESLGLQGDPTSPFWRRSALGFLWKEWC